MFQSFKLFVQDRFVQQFALLIGVFSAAAAIILLAYHPVASNNQKESSVINSSGLSIVVSPDMLGDEPQYTGYELVFPENISEWQVTYTIENQPVSAATSAQYTVLIPTYWCKILNNGFPMTYGWRSCQPVVREVK